MSSGKKNAQHLALEKADVNDQVREDKDGHNQETGQG